MSTQPITGPPPAGLPVQFSHCATGKCFDQHTFFVEKASDEHLAKVWETQMKIETDGPPLRCEQSDGTVVLGFDDVARKGKHLRIQPNRTIDLEGGRGVWALFAVTPIFHHLPTTAAVAAPAAHTAAVANHDDVEQLPNRQTSQRDLLQPAGPSGVILRCVGHHEPGGKKAAYLAADSLGKLTVTADWTDPSALWNFVAKDSYELSGIRAMSDFDHSVVLSTDQLQHFAEEGYLIVKNAVPLNLVDDARRWVNHQMGKGPSAWVPDPEGNDPTKFVLPSSSHNAITSLVNGTAVWTLMQRLMGQGRPKRVGGGQLAIRFPVVETEAAFNKNPKVGETGPNGWHIDGGGKGNLWPFSLLVKIPLSDQSETGNGNFTVWPRTHRNPEVIQWYKRHINDKVKSEATPATREADKPKNVGQPFQIQFAPGDVVFAHPYLSHSVGRNTSPNIRYSLIYRVQGPDPWQPTIAVAERDDVMEEFHGCRGLY